MITLKSGLPAVTTSDNDKLLKVVSGAWAASTISIPTKVSDLTNDSGFTSNVGTITGITMNGASKGTSGVVDLGTVITSHQDISGKVNGPSTSVNNNIAIFDGTTGKLIKVSGYTIAKSIPSSAVFTDTTYTFANGTNGFTVTPSGGTAQTVTVIPVIANAT